MPSSILSAGATALVSSGLGSLFGGDEKASTEGFAPTGIAAGGLTSGFDSRGNLTISSSGERQQAVKNVADTFGGQIDALSRLQGQVTPGVSAFRKARLGELENSRLNAIGNLRDNLARRRVLGSSFGQDAITRAEAEFGKLRENVAAESFLQELELTNNLLQQEYTARRAQSQTYLDELNLEANIAVGLAGKATDVLAKNAQVDAMLNAQAQAGAGKFFGQISEPVGKATGKFFSDLFK